MLKEKKWCALVMLVVFFSGMFAWSGHASAEVVQGEENMIETADETDAGYEDLLEKDEQAPVSEHPVAAKPKDHPAH